MTNDLRLSNEDSLETQSASKLALILRENLSCEVYTDPLHLGIYATDASIYQITPLAVVLPRNKEDIIQAVKMAYQLRAPILSRGGGTSLAGQTVGEAIVMDYSKYYNKVIEYFPENKSIKVQPGIVLEDLNRTISNEKLIFAPDPATANRATIGGMIGNNSSGTKSILYGKTIDNIREIELLLSDGQILQLKTLDSKEFSNKTKQIDREGIIYKEFKKIIDDHAELIESNYPKTMRRVSGYALDEFIISDHWNLAKLVCGSEGTLGVIISATLKLVDLPTEKAIILLHFNDRISAISSVKEIVKTGPSAVELIDHFILEQSKSNALTRRDYEKCVKGDPDCLLITEFYGDSTEEIDRKIENLSHVLDDVQGIIHRPIYKDSQHMSSIWSLRKNGLGIAMGSYNPEKPIPFVEDSAIPLEYLAEYISAIDEHCKKLEVEMVIYAHASVGVLHVRPYLNLRKAEDIHKLKDISAKVFQLVRKYKGSWSGEHGDGLARSYKLKEYFGDELYSSFITVKNLFDPDYIMNPGKIVEAQSIEKNLRYGIHYHDQDFPSVFHYRKEKSFQHIVHNCSGIGACRKTNNGTMCPSYMATLDELHSTRGRGNALRLAMSGQLGNESLDTKEVLDALDLCLSCKACKSECPSNVDMAKLKSEVLQMNYKNHGNTAREKIVSNSATHSGKLCGRLAPVVNWLQGTGFFKMAQEMVFDISRHRKLPVYSTFSFASWFRKNYKSPIKPKGKVLLFADTYTNYHEPNIGIAAVGLLSSMGYEILLADAGCCQRPRISNGFLIDAKLEGSQTVERLLTGLISKIPILVLEPGCASALQEDLPDLIDEEEISSKLQNQVKLIDVFILEEMTKGKLKGRFRSKYPKIAFHGHCHQKALYSCDALHSIYNSIQGLEFHEIQSGCCGMAGAFGYEKEHYAISRKIANLVLIPAIQELSSDMVVVANGFSCRHQIADFSGRKAKHFVETIEYQEVQN